jgi:hypothetical protein
MSPLLPFPAPLKQEVCTVSMDRTLKIWEADSGQCLSTAGPDITAKLCLAPNHTMSVVAVAGVRMCVRLRARICE